MDILLTAASMSLAAYLAGSFSTAYFLTRFVRKVDIRELGSGNAGAANVFREVGAWAGVSVLSIDALKGAAVVLVVSALDLGDYVMLAGAMAVVIGHNFPVFLGFRGGKGVAPIFGLSLAVLPILTLISLALSFMSGLATQNLVFGISVGFVAINVLTISTRQSMAQISLCLALSAVVIATHFALSYREVLSSVRSRGLWGLFEVE